MEPVRLKECRGQVGANHRLLQGEEISRGKSRRKSRRNQEWHSGRRGFSGSRGGDNRRISEMKETGEGEIVHI